MKKEHITMIIFIVLLGGFWSSALVVVDNVTQPYIEKYQREKLRKGILEALEIPYNDEDIDDIFDNNIEILEFENGEKTIYRTKDKGEIAFNITGAGSQGPISGVLAMEADLKTIKGVRIVSQVETPGLGDRVLSRSTLDRFKGKSIVPEIRILPKGGASTLNEVDGITGATLTCKAFQAILNSESKKYLSLIGVEGK